MQITSILRRAAQINPDGIATIFQERQQSWSQMADRVARLAGALQGILTNPPTHLPRLNYPLSWLPYNHVTNTNTPPIL